MRISLLGPLRVDGAAGSVSFGAAKERSLLSALALCPGSVVSTDVLINALWGDGPPPAARKTLQTYVWNLRQALGADAIATESPGYVLRVDPEDVDVVRFRRYVREGEEAIRSRATGRAAERFGAAVALWRGEPFAGVASHTGLATEAVRLKEEYLSALEARLTADLAEGREHEVVADLEGLVLEHPFRERLWAHLMVALYRCGRQADSLAAFQRVRQLLVSELGLEPGGELRRIEAAVLNHEIDMVAPVVPAPERPPTSVRAPVRYARCHDGVGVAFQVAGDGPIDILAIPGFISHLDIWWNAPTDRLVRRLTGMGRVISFDKRGMGLSDRPDRIHADQWIDDAMTVLDAAGTERAVVLGVSAGSLTAVQVAARYPERVRALVLYGGFARTLAAPGYEVGLDRAIVESFVANMGAKWGTGVAIGTYAPSRAGDAGVRDYWARYQQLSASPASAMRFLRAAIEADVRDVLPTVSVPTLVVHAERDRIVPIGQARYVADHIPGAEFVALPSDVHLMCLSDVIDEMTDAIGDFVTRAVAGTPVG